MTRAKIPKSRVVAKTPMEVAADRRAKTFIEVPDPLPCPYCVGGPTDLVSGQREGVAYAVVICRTCAARGPTFLAHGRIGSTTHVKSAVDTWNRVAGA